MVSPTFLRGVTKISISVPHVITHLTEKKKNRVKSWLLAGRTYYNIFSFNFNILHRGIKVLEGIIYKAPLQVFVVYDSVFWGSVPCQNPCKKFFDSIPSDSIRFDSIRFRPYIYTNQNRTDDSKKSKKVRNFTKKVLKSIAISEVI